MNNMKAINEPLLPISSTARHRVFVDKTPEDCWTDFCVVFYGAVTGLPYIVRDCRLQKITDLYDLYSIGVDDGRAFVDDAAFARRIKPSDHVQQR